MLTFLLDQGKHRCIPPKSLSFIFETLLIILFDCALSLHDLYGTVFALVFSFLIILVCPCYISSGLLELARRRYRCWLVERPRVGNRCLYTHYYWRLILDKMETGWSHLWGLVDHSEGKGGESVVSILRFLCGSPRSCRLRTEGLVPMSKYWTYRSHISDMRPVSLVAYCQQIFIFLHYFISWLRRETRYGPMDRSAGMLWIVSGALFWEQWLCPTLSVTHERLLRTGITRRKRTPDICGLAWEAYVSCWSGFPVHGVHRFESSWLSDMSNRLFVAAIK
jgi:hypothetical protein